MKKLITSLLIKLFKINKEDLLAASSEKREEIKDTTHLLQKESIETSLSIDLKLEDSCFVEPVLEKKKTVKQKKIQKEDTTKLLELTEKEKASRDLSEMMEVPFLALSKNRIRPICYEKKDGKNTMRVRISPHSEHYIASIYDWDIILFVAGKIQKIINDGSDIPPRKIIFSRHEILKALRKHDGKKQEIDLRAALSRLQATRVETNIRNEDGRHGSVFSFIDGWAYTDRKDVREIWVNLSDWLYEGICAKGSLLMVDSAYFSITSGLKKFLYRTARKHAGIQGGSWEFLLKTLHEKSGSEQEFKLFKRDLKKAVFDNDIPGYNLEWIEKENKVFVNFKHIDFTKSKLLIN
jgi:plasmid replication initiation protein